MTYLVDTNVISELARRAPSGKVLVWAEGISSIAVSAITVEEVYFGLNWKPNQRISGWFERFFSEHCTVLPVTGEIARMAGTMRGQLASKGRQRTQSDMLVAATAQTNKLTLVTRNTRDFDGCGIAVFDPFA
ncbi:MAG: type II toxin-antitoxin system VapC family toxin [Burkholderiales bacterium]